MNYLQHTASRRFLKLWTWYYLPVLLLFFSSCKKYLDAKSDQKLSTPGTLTDLQAILDNVTDLNRGMIVPDIASDDYYVTGTDYQSVFNKIEADAHIWHSATDDLDDWTTQYNIVFRANTVLDHLKDVVEDDPVTRNNINGAALFFRAHSFYLLAQIYAKQYDPATASTDLGIPLRLTSNFNETSQRASVQETYDRIIQDLLASIPLLPKDVRYKTRPGKQASMALLSRIYLIQGNYALAKKYADSCLAINQTLIDYSSLDNSTENPIPQFNAEVIFYGNSFAPYILQSPVAKLDSVLYRSFDDNDCRKEIFFRDNGDNTVGYKTSYNGSAALLFTGIATDEIFLNRAECYAREDAVDAAMSDLNALLITRWKDNGSFVPFTAANGAEALTLILQERRKELMMRGLRWTDIRRLNRTGMAITLKRMINGAEFTLLPNNPRSTFLIPLDVIRLSGIPQNPR